jgi:hypothetical protein
MKIAATVASLALAAVLLGGCGDSAENSPTDKGSSTAPEKRHPSAPAGARTVRCESPVPAAKDIRATGLGCERAAVAIRAWEPGRCLPAAGGSRAGCRVGPFRCASVASGRGYSVSCAARGRSIAFTVPTRR